MRGYKGIFKANNPQKYKGDSTKIVFRSLWERKFMIWLDSNPGVLWWATDGLGLRPTVSENSGLFVPYFSKVDNKMHRYFPDFIFATQKDGKEQVYMIEVKPHAQTQLPKQPKKASKKFINEVKTYSVNKSKWEAAKAFCDQNGWIFKILTEKDLFPKTKSNK